MVHLIFDTNIWIYLAEGQHPFVLDGIIEKVNNGEISLLVNDEIIKEWDRNKDDSLNRIEKELEKQIDYAKELSSTLEEDDSMEQYSGNKLSS
jgi:predicted nucleic acid-binding protein